MIDALVVVQLAALAAILAHAWVDLFTSPKLPREPRAREHWPKLSVVVPARDEEENIGACVESLLAQDYDALEIVVVDDGSTDRTAEIVSQYAGRDPRVRLAHNAERPLEWQGKCWALHEGTKRATGEWLALIDADVALGPRALRRAVSLALERHVVFLSLLPALRDVTFWEKVIQPVVGLLIFVTQPLWRARAPRSNVVVANGQFLLVERDAYVRAGGHASVKNAIVEDVELARVYKHLGLPLLLTTAFGDVEVRMYRGLRGIWRGWGKTLHPYVAAHPVGLWIGLASMLVVFFLPFVALPVALASGGVPSVVAGEAAAAAWIVANALLFRRVSRHEMLHGLLWPVAIVILLALFVARTAAVVRGAGVTWKGRRYG